MFRNRASQLVDFSNMVFARNATPTDIDGFLELDNRFFVFFDLKHENAEKIQGGQKMAYSRLTDAIHNPDKNKHCITLIAKHNTPPEVDIQAADCMPALYASRRVIFLSCLLMVVFLFVDAPPPPILSFSTSDG